MGANDTTQREPSAEERLAAWHAAADANFAVAEHARVCSNDACRFRWNELDLRPPCIEGAALHSQVSIAYRVARAPYPSDDFFTFLPQVFHTALSKRRLKRDTCSRHLAWSLLPLPFALILTLGIHWDSVVTTEGVLFATGLNLAAITASLYALKTPCELCERATTPRIEGVPA